MQLVDEVHKFMNKMSGRAKFQGRIIFMSMFNDIIWRTEDNEQECISNATLVSLFAKRFPAGRWSFLGLASEKKWYSTYNKFRESGHPVFRATSALTVPRNAQKQGGGKLSMHFCAVVDTIKNVFRTIVSVNQLSIYGAVSDVCEEYSTCQTRTWRPVLAGHSDPLFEPASTDAGFPKTVEVGQYFMTKPLSSSHDLQNQ